MTFDEPRAIMVAVATAHAKMTGETAVRERVMVNRVLVLGGGSAGFLAALTLKIKMPELPVTVLRSKDIGIIGVGEGTTPNVPLHMFGYLGINPGELHRLAQPSWKLGIRF